MKTVINLFSRNDECRFSTFLLVLFNVVCCLALTCQQTAENSATMTIAEPKSEDSKGTASDFDVSGQYYAGFCASTSTSYNDNSSQTGFYPNTFPKAAIRLEVMQHYPNWRDITVKLAARFYDKHTSGTISTWICKGRFLGMGTGTLTPMSGSPGTGSYQVAFEINDNFIDAADLPTAAPLKFVFSGKTSQISFRTHATTEDPITSNMVLVITGTMTITDNQHKVYSSSTTTKQMAAKRWLVENLQPF